MIKPRFIQVTNALKIEKPVADVDGRWLIRGVGAHFGTVNGNGEIITAGAFEKFFDQLRKGGFMPRLNVMHGWGASDLVGAWTKIEATDTELVCEGFLYDEIELVKKTVLPLMKIGALNYLSTEGWATQWEEKDGVFVIKEFDLMGVSLVDIPADMRQSPLAVANSALTRRPVAEMLEEKEEKQEGEAEGAETFIF